MSERPKTKLKPIGVLWKPKDPESKVLLSGQVDLPDGTKLRVKMMKNNFKEKETQPDYKLFTDVPLDEGDDAIAEAKEVFGA